VWEQTVARLRQSGQPFAALPAWYDVDELQDLIRLRDELDQIPESEPVWEPLREAIRRALPPAHGGS